MACRVAGWKRALVGGALASLQGRNWQTTANDRCEHRHQRNENRPKRNWSGSGSRSGGCSRPATTSVKPSPTRFTMDWPSILPLRTCSFRYSMGFGKQPERGEEGLRRSRQLVSQSHSEARRLISEVRPPVIDEIGVETAISHLVHEQRQRGGPTIKFDSDVYFKRLPSILENAIYRIAQEALTNACRHSKSKKVAVTMTQEGQDVRLEVQDWGIGFDRNRWSRATLAWRVFDKGCGCLTVSSPSRPRRVWNPGSGRCANSGEAERRIGQPSRLKLSVDQRVCRSVLGIEQFVKLQWKSLPQKPPPKVVTLREHRLSRSRNDSPESMLNFVVKSPSLPPHISSENSARLIGLLPESLYDLFFHCKISSGEEVRFRLRIHPYGLP